MGGLAAGIDDELPVYRRGVLGHMYERLIQMVSDRKQKSDKTRAEFSALLKKLGSQLAPSLAAKCEEAKRVLVVGCGTDFDECCLPLLTVLQEKKVVFGTRCYWLDFNAGASAFGGDIAIVSQEYSDSEGDYDLVIVITSVIPAVAFLDALIARIVETEATNRIKVAPFLISNASRSAIANSYRGVDLENDLAQTLKDGPEANLFYGAFEESLARPRRYFRHMPPSIEAELTGHDLTPDASLSM